MVYRQRTQLNDFQRLLRDMSDSYWLHYLLERHQLQNFIGFMSGLARGPKPGTVSLKILLGPALKGRQFAVGFCSAFISFTVEKRHIRTPSGIY